MHMQKRMSGMFQRPPSVTSPPHSNFIFRKKKKKSQTWCMAVSANCNPSHNEIQDSGREIMAKNKHSTRTMLCILLQGLFDYIVQKIIEGGLRWCPQARQVSLARQVSSSGRGKELKYKSSNIFRRLLHYT